MSSSSVSLRRWLLDSEAMRWNVNGGLNKISCN